MIVAAQLQITVRDMPHSDALRDAFQSARRQLIEHAERGQSADKSRRSRVRLMPAGEGVSDE